MAWQCVDFLNCRKQHNSGKGRKKKRNMAKKIGQNATSARVARRAKRRGVKMQSPKKGRISAVLPPLPMSFREAVKDYLSVKPDDMVVVLSKDDQRKIEKSDEAIKRIRRGGKR
jgi:hypothetical protein